MGDKSILLVEGRERKRDFSVKPYQYNFIISSKSDKSTIHHHHHHHQSLVSTMLGSPTLILFFNSDISRIKSSNKLHFFKYIFTTSFYVLLGLLLPSTSIAKPFLIGAIVGLHWTCPNYLKWFFFFFLILFPIDVNPKCSRTHSFLILSFLVLPHIYLNTFISATSILYICCFLIDQHSAP